MPLPTRRNVAAVPDLKSIANDNSLNSDEKLKQISEIVEDETSTLKSELEEITKLISEIKEAEVNETLMKQMLMIQKAYASSAISMAEIQAQLKKLETDVSNAMRSEEVSALVVSLLEPYAKLVDTQAKVDEVKAMFGEYLTKERFSAEKEAHDADIAMLNNKLAEIHEEMAKLSNAIEKVQSQIETVKHEILNVVEVNKQASIAYTDAAVKNLQASITAEMENRITKDGEITGNMELIRRDLQSQISLNASEIDATKANISELSQQVEKHVSECSEKHAELKAAIAKNIEDIALNASAISKNSSDIESIQGQVGVHEDKIASLVTSTQSHDESIKNNKDLIDGIHHDLEEINEALKALVFVNEGDAQIQSSLKETFTALAERFNKLQTIVNSNNADLSSKHEELKATIEEIKEKMTGINLQSEEIRKLKQTVYGSAENVNDKSGLTYQVSYFHECLERLYNKMIDIPSLADFTSDLKEIKDSVATHKSDLESLKQRVETLENVDTSKFALADHTHDMSAYATKSDLVQTEANAQAKFTTKEEVQESVANVLSEAKSLIAASAVDTSAFATNTEVSELKSSVESDIELLKSTVAAIAPADALAGKLEIFNNHESLKDIVHTYDCDVAHNLRAENTYVSNMTGIMYIVEPSHIEEIPANVRAQFLEPEYEREAMILSIPDEEYVFIPKYVFIPTAVDGEMIYRKYIIRTFSMKHTVCNLQNTRRVDLHFLEYVYCNHEILSRCASLEEIKPVNMLYFVGSNNFGAGCSKEIEVELPSACQIAIMNDLNTQLNARMTSVMDALSYGEYAPMKNSTDRYEFNINSREKMVQAVNDVVAGFTATDDPDGVLAETIKSDSIAIIDNIQARLNEIKKCNFDGLISDIDNYLSPVPAASTGDDETALIDKIKGIAKALEDGLYSGTISGASETEASVKALVESWKNGLKMDMSADDKKKEFLSALKTNLKAYSDSLGIREYNESRTQWKTPGNPTPEELNHVTDPELPSFYQQLYSSSVLTTHYNKSSMSFNQFVDMSNTRYFDGQSIITNPIKGDIPYNEELDNFEKDEVLREGTDKVFRMLRVLDEQNGIIDPAKFSEIEINTNDGVEEGTSKLDALWNDAITPVSYKGVFKSDKTPYKIIRRHGRISYLSKETFANDAAWSGKLWRSVNDNTPEFVPYKITASGNTKYISIVRNGKLYVVQEDETYNVLKTILSFDTIITGTGFDTSKSTVSTTNTQFTYKQKNYTCYYNRQTGNIVVGIWDDVQSKFVDFPASKNTITIAAPNTPWSDDTWNTFSAKNIYEIILDTEEEDASQKTNKAFTCLPGSCICVPEEQQDQNNAKPDKYVLGLPVWNMVLDTNGPTQSTGANYFFAEHKKVTNASTGATANCSAAPGQLLPYWVRENDTILLYARVIPTWYQAANGNEIPDYIYTLEDAKMTPFIDITGVTIQGTSNTSGISENGTYGTITLYMLRRVMSEYTKNLYSSEDLKIKGLFGLPVTMMDDFFMENWAEYYRTVKQSNLFSQSNQIDSKKFVEVFELTYALQKALKFEVDETPEIVKEWWNKLKAKKLSPTAVISNFLTILPAFKEGYEANTAFADYYGQVDSVDDVQKLLGYIARTYPATSNMFLTNADKIRKMVIMMIGLLFPTIGGVYKKKFQTFISSTEWDDAKSLYDKADMSGTDITLKTKQYDVDGNGTTVTLPEAVMTHDGLAIFGDTYGGIDYDPFYGQSPNPSWVYSNHSHINLPTDGTLSIDKEFGETTDKTEYSLIKDIKMQRNNFNGHDTLTCSVILHAYDTNNNNVEKTKEISFVLGEMKYSTEFNKWDSTPAWTPATGYFTQSKPFVVGDNTTAGNDCVLDPTADAAIIAKLGTGKRLIFAFIKDKLFPMNIEMFTPTLGKWVSDLAQNTISDSSRTMISSWLFNDKAVLMLGPWIAQSSDAWNGNGNIFDKNTIGSLTSPPQVKEPFIVNAWNPAPSQAQSVRNLFK